LNIELLSCHSLFSGFLCEVKKAFCFFDPDGLGYSFGVKNLD